MTRDTTPASQEHIAHFPAVGAGTGSLYRTPIDSNNHLFDLQKLEDCDRKAVHQIDQLQREQRHLKRRLEKLGAERTRMDSVGSVVSSERSDSDRGESQLPEGLQATEPTPEQIR